MEEKYVFNKAEKRIEPIEKKCLYCDYGYSQDMEDNYFAPIFKENDRTNVVVYRSVKYSKVLIGIPRCPTCLEIHKNAKRKGLLYAWIIAIVVFALAIATGNGVCMGIGVFLGILIIVAGSHYIGNRLVEQHDIFTEKDGAERCDLVQDFILEGWSMTQPTA